MQIQNNNLEQPVNQQPGNNPQAIQVNPVTLANEIIIKTYEQLNILRMIIADLTNQLDSIKKPKTHNQMIEFDAQKRTPTR